MIVEGQCVLGRDKLAREDGGSSRHKEKVGHVVSSWDSLNYSDLTLVVNYVA